MLHSIKVREMIEPIGTLGCSIKITHNTIPYFNVLKIKRYTGALKNNEPNLIQNLFCVSADGMFSNGSKMVFICLSIRLFWHPSDNTCWMVNVYIVKLSNNWGYCTTEFKFILDPIIWSTVAESPFCDQVCLRQGISKYILWPSASTFPTQQPDYDSWTSIELNGDVYMCYNKK